MILKDILNAKGHEVFTISPDVSLASVVERLVQHRCGALVVCEGETMIGIISERDILRTLAEVTEPLDQVAVESRMTSKVITGSPEDDINDVMGRLTENRIRHLPVLERGRLVGVISIGDVVKAQHDHLTMENHYLMNYIQS